jgi:hypothetical protein
MHRIARGSSGDARPADRRAVVTRLAGTNVEEAGASCRLQARRDPADDLDDAAAKAVAAVAGVAA